MTKDNTLQLPPEVVTKRHLVRLINELETVDNALTSRSIRRSVKVTDKNAVEVPSSVKDFFELNNWKVTNNTNRSKALGQLRTLRRNAPVTHLTFAADADEASLREIAGWLRQTVHPHVVLETGLQPGLVAGMYMRAQNRIFDYSLRSRLESQRSILIEALGVGHGAK